MGMGEIVCLVFLMVVVEGLIKFRDCQAVGLSDHQESDEQQTLLLALPGCRDVMMEPWN